MDTLLKRLVHLTLATMFTSAVVLSSVHFPLFRNYLISEKLHSMQSNGRQLSTTTVNLLQNSYPFMSAFLEMNLDIVASATDSYIMIVSTDGQITARSSSMGNYYNKPVIDMNGFRPLLNGQEVVGGKFFDPYFKAEMLTFATPIVLNDAVIGAAIITAPQPRFGKEYRDQFSVILISMSIAAFVAFTLSYYLARRIAKPIRRIKYAAKEIELGKFENRIDGCGIEEIDELCLSFNSMATTLEKLENTRRDFISNVSHDLKTPMTTITGFVGGILDGTIPPEKEREYLEIVLSETRRLTRLVNESLDLAKYETGKSQLKFTAFDINELLRVRVNAFETQINQRCLTVEFQFQKERTIVKGDIDSIDRVISNLIENAIKYSTAMTVLKINVSESGKKAIISIENTGQPIPQEALPFLFDRFYKVDKSRSSAKESFGLGLFIVKSILTEHNQTIHASCEGNVTTFTFTLELTRENVTIL